MNRIEKKRASHGRMSADMEEDIPEERLITEEELALWGFRTISEANAAIARGRMPGPFISGYKSGPMTFRRR